MRAFLEILKFELRYQIKTPFFWGILLLFFLIHLLTVTSVGIHLGQNHRIDINGAGKILQVVCAYIYLAMLPTAVFVIRAIISDFDRSTASFFFVTPVKKSHFLLGRFASAFIPALGVGCAGLWGVLIGPFAPWAAQLPAGEFTWIPYGFSFAAIIVPNLFIVCALFFSVAALTRSAAMTVAVIAVLLAGDAVLAVYTRLDDVGWAAMADPFGALTIRAETRYWTLPELNSNLPGGLLLENRLLWLGIAFAAMTFTLWRFRLDLSEGGLSWTSLVPSRRNEKTSAAPPLRELDIEPRFSFRDALFQFSSQLKMDFLGVVKGPLLYVLLLGVVLTVVGESSNHFNPLSNLPYYPLTRLMLETFYYGLSPLIMMMAIYYSGALVHREKDSGIADVIGASPYTDWIMPVSKTAALFLVTVALLLTAMLTSMALQASAGHTDFEIGLYLKSLFVYNGFHYGMLCVLAVFIQVLVSNKWFGMLLTFTAFVILVSLPSFGVEHILVGYRIPFSIYSDMDGYGPATALVFSLIGYWGFFCILLIVDAHTVYPRGSHATFMQRLRNARTRINRGVAVTIALAFAGFMGVGSWIFYNTNILNQYQSTKDRQRSLAEYETNYGHYLRAPAPSYNEVAMEVDLYPEQRRLESRGTGILRNNKSLAIGEFVMSIDPRMRVNAFSVDSATLTKSDSVHGFYLFTLNSPLEPGKTVTVKWDLSRQNRGFVNGNPDYELVSNGTFIESEAIAPIPGLNDERFVTDDAWRRRLGLKPAERLPALGDPEHLNVLKFGVDSHSEFRAIVSTSADQVAVTSGELQRDWVENGRHYFEYLMEHPTWPSVPFTSARYEIAKDRWNDVALEIYYDPKHGANIDVMLATIKRTLDYQTRNFAPYPISTFRIVEYPGYRSPAKAFPGIAAYPELYGFITDIPEAHYLDYPTIHELAHQWWGGLAYGAKMQGRQMLNETLAQYSTLMIFKENFGDEFAGQAARQLEDNYLSGRSDEARTEYPLMYTDDQGYISYNKGPLAFYALQDVIGEDKVNEALRRYLDKFAFKDAPFPTSRDVVNELRFVAGAEHEKLITDLFEKIILCDLEITGVELKPSGDLFSVSITVAAHQFEADELGKEMEVPLSRVVDIAVFSNSGAGSDDRRPIYQGKHFIETGTQTITVEVSGTPTSAEIDPLYKVIDRTRQNNAMKIEP